MHKEADIQAVHNLIAILADPVEAKAHLDEIKQHSAGAEQARVDRAAANKVFAQAREQADRNISDLAKERAALDARVKAVDLDEARLREREAALAPREKAVSEREVIVSSRESTISDRDTASQRRMDEVEAAERALADRVRKVQEAVG